MTSGNMIALCKILGKLAYWYDVAAADVPTEQQALAALMAQMAKPDAAANNPTVLIFSQAASGLNANITNGNVALQTSILNAAINYLTGSQVASYFVNNIPAAGANAAAVITALIAEMTTDLAYFDTAASTGLVHFLEQVASGASALPQTGTTKYADATYCVVAVL